jgi:hypothetical protein
MKRVWMVGVAVAAAMEAQAGSPKPRVDAPLVTVFTYNLAGVPRNVAARAKRVATRAFAAAGIEVRWVEGKHLGEQREVAAGEMRTVVFDGPAPATFRSQAMAVANVGRGADSDVHVFYDRVLAFQDSAYMPEFLGNVLAHELTHVLEGVARHSSEGLMKPVWSVDDIAEMFRGPLPFAAEDLDLLRAHFHSEMPPAPTLVTIW